MERCANPFARLDADVLAICLGALCSWQTAAAAAAVERSWRAALHSNAWPRAASAPAPRHWRQRKRFGWDWEEPRPFACPPRWSSPTGAPSWACALHGMEGVERVPRLLAWLDRVEEMWPGILVTRWPGAAQRLAWLRGATSGVPSCELRGYIRREFPKQSGSFHWGNYRDGSSSHDADELVPPCAFSLPADAAAFFALAPLGFGEEASDGDFVRPFAGFEVLVDADGVPRNRTRSQVLANLRALQPPLQTLETGCDPSKLLPIAHRVGSHQGPRHPTGEATVLLFCDEERPRTYGKLMLVEVKRHRGSGVSAEMCVAEMSFCELLELLLESVEAAVDASPEARAERASPNGSKWDLAWQAKHGAAERVIAAIQLASVPEAEPQPDRLEFDEAETHAAPPVWSRACLASE